LVREFLDLLVQHFRNRGQDVDAFVDGFHALDSFPAGSPA
jgi:hypothetical protein